MLEMKSYLNVLNRICEEVHRNMANKPKDSDSIDWDVNVEILLFYSMIGHKPVGVNRHFMMLFIHQKFSSYLNRQISSKVIWDHLDSMYDMAALHESEIIPFPNDEVEFELPEEYDDLIAAKFGTKPQRTIDENENSKSSSSLKLPKKIGASKLKQSSSTPIVPTKSTFATPVGIKTGKSNMVVRNEPKSPTVENNVKLKSETPLITKSNKIRRSSSPFSTKSAKTEPIPVAKEESDALSYKKVKTERSSSPASAKKVKVESSNLSNYSSKKSVNQEHNGNAVKQGKTETCDVVKKIKTEKEVVNKKGKLLPENNIKKNSKTDTSSSKKRNDVENSSKKSDSVSNNKQKTDGRSSGITNKGQKIEDGEASSTSASRKSSPVVKVDAGENMKKRKRQKLEETSKKITPLAKRRRT